MTYILQYFSVISWRSFPLETNQKIKIHLYKMDFDFKDCFGLGNPILKQNFIKLI